ncbi:MAG: hypothetical protein AMJ61_00480 [Desulfobacterales bacterium SG8_35_2]|nr:MAG: hypothetical protein AMJ61_00480 [Desulfobacterales bacterium SG8_35_2]
MRICLSIFFMFFLLTCSSEKKNDSIQASHHDLTVQFEQAAFEDILTKADNTNSMILVDFFAVW